ncbi:MAG: AsmA family protein [Hyphomonadaceae bacterium]
MWKRILIGLGVVIVLTAAAIAAFVIFFPKEAVRAEIERQVERATERDLTLQSVNVAFWPALGLSAETVSLSNPQGFPNTPFMRADRAVFAVAILPLITGNIQVKSIILDKPELALAVNRAGAANWAFPPSEENQRLDALRIDDLRVNDGRLSFQGATGDPFAAEDVDLSVSMRSLDTPADIDGAFTYLNQRIEAEAELALPRAMVEQGETPLTAQFESAHVNADFTGAFNAATGAIVGRVKAEGASLRETLAWLGSPLGPGAGFAAYSAEADLAARGSHEDAPTRLTFTNGAFALDAIRASGNVTLDVSEAGRILAHGALTIPTLDVNPYMPPPAQAAGQGQAGQAGVNVETAWSNAPIDLSGLNAADLNLDLAIGALKFQRMSFTNAQMNLRIANGAADARLTRLSLYGGSGTGRLTANANGNRITTELDAQNIQAEPLLRDAIGFDRITGRGRLRASISGAGASQAALMRTLAGNASFTFNDGQYKGVDLAAVARTIQSAMSGQARGTSAATDFAELSANFQLNNGVAVTQDLRMLNPFVRLDGQGLIDIGRQTIDMRIAPRAVNSIEGQGGNAGLAGLGVPFRIAGPWSRVQFSLALGDVVQRELRQRMSSALGGSLGSALGGQTQQSGQNQQSEQSQERRNPVEQLGDLFRRN